MKNAIAKPKCGTGENLDLAILQEVVVVIVVVVVVVVVVVAVVVVAVAVVVVAAVVVVGAPPTNQVYGVAETSSGDSSGNTARRNGNRHPSVTETTARNQAQANYVGRLV